MKITHHIEDKMCYYVSSETGRAEGYYVDLLANGGAGHCGCVNFGVVHFPKIKAGTRSYCKHILLCRNYFLDSLLTHLSNKERQH